MNKYAIVDAQYYLRRNMAAVGSKERICVPQLLASFLWSIQKLNKTFQAKKIILAWDTRPYKKLEGITRYKGDRVYAKDEVVRLSNEIETETDQSKIEELNKQLEYQKMQADNFITFCETRDFIINELKDCGFPSIKLEGYEADDLAYLGSRCISEDLIVGDEMSTLVSHDSDWNAFATKKCNVYTPVKNAYVTTYDDLLDKIPDRFKGRISYYKYRQLSDAYYGNHNNVVSMVDKNAYSLDDLVELYISTGNTGLNDYDKVVNSLIVDRFYNEIKTYLITNIQYGGSLNKKKFWEIYNELSLVDYVWGNVLGSLINRLDPTEYLGV